MSEPVIPVDPIDEASDESFPASSGQTAIPLLLHAALRSGVTWHPTDFFARQHS